MIKGKKEIIDNEDGTMAEFLKNALQDNRGQVSIATGYFNVEGYADLRDPLREAAKREDFRLRYKINSSRHEKRRCIKLNPRDLSVVGYEFLSPQAKQLKKRFLGDESSGRSLINLVTWTICAKISIQGKSSKKHLYLFWRKGSGLFLIISED